MKTNYHLYSRFTIPSVFLAETSPKDTDARSHTQIIVKSLKLINVMHLIPRFFFFFFTDMIEVSLDTLPATARGVYGHLATKHKFIFHLYTCILPLEDRAEKPKQSNTGGYFQGSYFWHEANIENS